jgi:hypothetical protein
MGYVTAEYYKAAYHGNSIPEECLQDCLDQASLDADVYTRMKIKKLGGFDNLSPHERVCVQLAICAQADHVYTKASLEGLSSYSIGDISVSFDASEEYSKTFREYLSMTRLAYRGI